MHDVTVPFEVRVVPGSEIDLAGWSWDSVPMGGLVRYRASGPCPACHADCSGERSDGPNPLERELVDSVFEVVVRCACGSSHGRDGATGCGRVWTVIGPKGQA